MTIPLKEILTKILSNYSNESKKTLKGNNLANYIRNIPAKELTTYLNNKFNDKNKFSAKGSVGQGSWTAIPWIAIFDNKITDTAHKGIYLVYLFSYDMSHVYLSLNQGWTFFKKHYKRNAIAASVASRNYFQEYLSFQVNNNNWNNISKNNIHLIKPEIKIHTDLPKGYETTNILSIKYDKNNIPSDDILQNDLDHMVHLLTHIENQITVKNNKNYKYTIENLIQDYNEKQNEEAGIDSNIIDHQELKPIYNISSKKGTAHNKSHNFIAHKINFDQIKKANKRNGDIGESLVVDYEKKQLEKIGRNDLSEKVEQVSVTKGDGLGYDVLSFDKNGSPKYIEVKSTTSKNNIGFYVSENELEFSINHPDNFYLYRVFNLNDINPSLYYKQGSLKDTCILQPQNFKAKFTESANPSIYQAKKYIENTSKEDLLKLKDLIDSKLNSH